MVTRTRWLSSMVLVMVFVVGAALGTADRAWAIGFILGQTKGELKLKYDVSVSDHGTGRVTVVFTLADEGRLKPLDEVQFVIPQRKKNNGRRYRMDLVVSIDMKETSGGRRMGRVHILKDLAERAQIRLNTWTMDGKMDPATQLYHVIPIAKYLKNAPAAAPAAKPKPASAADEKDARDSSAGHLQWVGNWEVSANVNRVLGFPDPENRLDETWVHPTSFRLSFDKEIGEHIPQQRLDFFRDRFFKPMGHEVVATGKWETVFAFAEKCGLGTNCFVTQQGGATFLWCEAPYVVVFGGRVALIQGKTRNRDVLVIDFNSFHDRLAGGQESQDTVAYKRSKEKQPADTPTIDARFKDEREKDALRLRFMVGDRYRGRSNGSNVEIVMWTAKPDGDGKHAVGYRLSLRRIIELAEAR